MIECIYTVQQQIAEEEGIAKDDEGEEGDKEEQDMTLYNILSSYLSKVTGKYT